MYGIILFRNRRRRLRPLALVASLLTSLLAQNAHAVGWALAWNGARITSPPGVGIHYNIVAGTHDADYCRDHGSPGYLDWYGTETYPGYAAGMSGAAGTYSVAVYRSDTGANVGCASGFTVYDGVSIYVGACGPTTYSLNLSVSNAETTRKRYQMDWDGDGDVDWSGILQPGGSTNFSATTTTAPANGVLLEETYLGDNQWTFATAAGIDAGLWTTSGDPGSFSAVLNRPPPSTDTVSMVSTNQRVQYAAPSGGGLTESTFRTGIESARSAQIDGTEAIVDAIARHQTNQSALLGAADRQTSAETRLSAASSGAASAVGASTNALGALRAVQAEGVTGSTPPSIFAVQVGADTINWSPDSTAGWWAMFRSVLVYGLWVTFAAFAGYTIAEAIKPALTAPQAVSSSTLPGFSSGVALAAGLAIIVIITALVTGAATYVSAQLTADFWASSGDWRSFTSGGISIQQIWGLADYFVPLTLCTTLATVALGLHLGINSLVVLASTAIRALGV